MKKLLLFLWAIPCLAQVSRNFPALDTTNVYTGTNIFTGPVTFGSGFVVPTITVGTIITTGPGFTQVFQSQTAPDATFRSSFMLPGQMVWFGNSATGKWDCQNFDGSSCVGGVAAWSGVTSGTNSNAGTFAASGNTWDFTGVTQFKLRTGAGLTTSADGGIGYDTTNKMWHVWQNGADNFLISALASGTYTNGDCTSISKSGNIINFVDSGGACGGSGTASVLEFGCGGTISATVTDFCGIGNVATSEGGTQVPMPRAGTFGNMQCHIGGAGLSSSQAVVITFRKNGASQTSTCTLNSGSPNNCSDGTHTFAVVAGDLLDFQTVPSNTPTVAAVNCTGTY